MSGLDGAGLDALLARPGLRRVLAALQAPGEETRLVGGAVRDALLGLPVADLDLATTLRPEAAMARAKAAGLKVVPTGLAHGTVTIVADGTPYETTTLREDIETDGRHAVVRFGRDFARDAERRDFTINALSLSTDGTLHDTTGGADDLAAGRVRFIGEPAARIREDNLRILRFFRFHARYGRGEPDAPGLAAAVAGRDGLARLSRERVRSEFLRLLVAPRALDAVTAMAEAGLLQRILAGVGDGGRLRRVVRFEAMHDLAPNAVRRLAALAVLAPDDAGRLADGLRLSRAELARCLGYGGAAAALHASSNPLDEAAVRRLAAEHGLEALEDGLAALDGEPTPHLLPEAQALTTRFRTGSLPVPAFPLTGADLVAAGLRPGPDLGLGLAAARRAWLAEGCPEAGPARERLLALALDAARDGVRTS